MKKFSVLSNKKSSSYYLKGIFMLACGFASQFVAAQESKQKEMPNIVFIISDQHKLEATGAYGSETAITPNIDALAQNGIIFNNCYTPAPVCAPARAALLTGMNPYANGAIYHKAPIKMPNGKTKLVSSGELRASGYKEDIKTFAEQLKIAGYRTAAPGKMHVHGELQRNVDRAHPQGNSMGFDESSVRYYTHFPGGHYEDEVGEDTYQRYRQFQKYKDVYNKGPMHLNNEYVPTLVENEEDVFDMVVARKAVEFINKNANKEEPFFIHVGFEKPHAPFTTTQKYLDMHDPKKFSLPATADDWVVKGRYPYVPNWIHSGIPKQLEEAQNVMAAYNACVTEMDDMVGRVIQALKDNGVYENTIIIYTSDHGEHLFEHGLRGKHCMYDDAVNVPFIVSYPKQFKQNIKLNSLISLIDVYPTLCEIAGVEIPAYVQGTSLLNLLQTGEEIANRPIFSEFRGADYFLLPGQKLVPSRMLREDQYKFIYTHGIIHQLYDLDNDPEELENLAVDPAQQERLNNLYFKTLAEWRFQEYSPIEVKIKKDKMTWRASDQFAAYSVFYSETADPNQAKAIASELLEPSYSIEKKGYYWVLAHPKFSKKTDRYAERGAAVETYSYTLPISDPINF
jgi:arylsulfatase A-like enzyme